MLARSLPRPRPHLHSPPHPRSNPYDAGPTPYHPSPKPEHPSARHIAGSRAASAPCSRLQAGRALGAPCTRPPPRIFPHPPPSSSAMQHCRTAPPPPPPPPPPPLPPPHRPTAAPPHRATAAPQVHHTDIGDESCVALGSLLRVACSLNELHISDSEVALRGCNCTPRARVRARANPSPNLRGVAAQPQGCSYIAPTSDITPEMRPIPNPSPTHPGDSARPARSRQGGRHRWLRRGRSEAPVRQRAAPGGRGGACDRARVPGRRHLPAAGNPNPSLTLTLAPALTLALSLALTLTLSLRCSDPDRARALALATDPESPAEKQRHGARHSDIPISSGLSCLYF